MYDNDVWVTHSDPLSLDHYKKSRVDLVALRYGVSSLSLVCSQSVMNETVESVITDLKQLVAFEKEHELIC